jgi:alkylation response protein AidB-like acyl-CoA dehydrogenase
MRFALTEEQQFLVDTVTKFLSKELPSQRLREWLGQAAGSRYADWWRQCATLGWAGIFADGTSEEYGSVSGVPLVDAALVAEVAGSALSPAALTGASATAAAFSHTAGADVADVIDGVLDGTIIASLALEEAGGDWELSELTTTATSAGDGYLLAGSKIHVPDAATAGAFLVGCRIDDNEGYVLVRADQAGITAEDGRGLDLLRTYGTVTFDNVRVPRGAAFAGETKGVTDVLRIATCLQMAESVGATDALLTLTIDYARSRYAFGRPIGSFQAFKHRIADLVLWTETAKGTVDAAIDAVATDSADSDLLLSVAKSYVGDQTVRIAQECTQMFGGIGLTYEHDAHLYLRRVTANRALLGTPEQHRARIARLLDVACMKGTSDG